MSERVRMIVGWVVTLLHAEKGGARQWERAHGDDVGFDGPDLTPNRGERYVWGVDEYGDACDSLARIARAMAGEGRRRLRILPVYRRQRRTAEDERADAVEHLKSLGMKLAADELESGRHVGAVARVSK